MDSSAPHSLLHKRKRTSLPSSAFSGTFTRSKSQIYVHSNRSGRARTDALRKPVHRFYHLQDVEANRAIPIKDLRARRVFPTGPARSQSPNNDREKMDNGLSRNGKSLDFLGGGNGEEKVGNDGDVGEEVLDFGGGVEQRKESSLSVKGVANMRQTRVFIAPGSFSYRRLLPFLEDIKPANCEMGIVDGKSQNNLSHRNHESHVQKLSDTILNEQSVTEYNGVECKDSSQISSDEKIRDAESHKFSVPSNTERDISDIVNNDADAVNGDCLLNNEHINGDIEQLKGPNSSNKMVSNLRPKKVFKPPGSFSYRRLLPFLEDTEEDQTTSSKIGIVNEKSPDNLSNRNLESCDQGGSIMALNERLVTGSPCKGSRETSHDERTDNAGSQEFEVHPIAKPDMSGVVNNDADSVFGLVSNEILKKDMDDPTIVVDLIEDHLQSTPEQDIQPLVNNHVDTAFGGSILNNSDSQNHSNCLTGVNDSSEEYVQSILEQDLLRVVKNIADTVLGDTVLDGSMKFDPDVMTGVTDLHEVDVQMTPPDAVIFTTPEIEGNLQDIEDKGCVTKSIPPRHTSNITDANGMCNVNTSSVNANQSITTPSKIGTVLNPCSRQRVFKPSSSFSYRRLLPYLTSVSGDQHPGLVKTSKEGSSMNHFKPVSSPETQETGENKDNQTVLTPTPNVSSLNSDSGSNSSDHVPTSVTSASINGHVKVLDIQSEEPSRTVNIGSTFLSKLNPELSFEKGVSLHDSNPNTVLTDSKKEASQNELDRNGHDFMLVDNEQLSETIRTKESPSKDPLLNHTSHGNGSQRGILKRNPRGCRGLCICLHCASFRLHAERTFEFSRNQLHDAEEVASNLVKELSSLRHMLERSAAEATDQTVIHLNQLQVMEACRKAVEAEELAKERLNEMNDDLNHHCRTKSLSRPRVAFLSKKPRNE